MPNSPRRRTLLKGIGSVGAGGLLAGCSGILGGGGGGNGTNGSAPANGRDAGNGSGNGNSTGGSGTGNAAAHTAAAQPPQCDEYETLARADLNGGATISAGCYRVESTHAIDSGTLTLEAGVVIEFAADAGLHFSGNGALETAGTTAEPVFLRGQTEERGFWQGLRFQDSTATTSLLENVVIEHAGSTGWHGGEISQAGVFVQESTVELAGATVRSNARSGLTVPDSGTDVAIANTVFEANERSARLHADLAGDFAANNEVTGNDADAVMLSGTGTSDTVATEQTWTDPGVAFYAPKTVVVEAGLTIDPGTAMAFKEGKGLDVNGGALTVAGSGQERVTFRGLGGGRGAWAGIRFVDTPSPDNLLAHADVIGGGGALWHGADRSKAGVYVQGTDVQLTVQDVDFTENAVTALTADGGGSDRADLTIEETTFADNAVPMRLHADLVGAVAESVSFQNNDGSYVLVGAQGSATTVTNDATWEALGVPYRVTRHCHCNAGLTISPGTTIETHAEKGFYVPEGSLTADASESEESILFTDADDGDGNWQGISFNTTDSGNRFDDVVVENAGNGLWTGNWDSHAAIFVYGGDDNGGLQIQNSTIRGSAGHGIAKSSKGVLSCGGGMTFQSIADSPVYEMYTGEIQVC